MRNEGGQVSHSSSLIPQCLVESPPQEQGLDRAKRVLYSLLQVGLAQTPNRVVDDRERLVGQPADASRGAAHVLEGLGAHRRRRNAAQLHLDAVVHTARAAGASVADSDHDGVAAGGHHLEDVVRCDPRRVGFAGVDRLGDLPPLSQALLHELEERPGIGLAVIQEADHQAVERTQAPRRHRRPPFVGSLGRIEQDHPRLRYHHGCHLLVGRARFPRPGGRGDPRPYVTISLVTGRELPPPTSSSTSSGPPTADRYSSASPGSGLPGARPSRFRSATLMRASRARKSRAGSEPHPARSRTAACSGQSTTTKAPPRSRPLATMMLATERRTPSGSLLWWL